MSRGSGNIKAKLNRTRLNAIASPLSFNQKICLTLILTGLQANTVFYNQNQRLKEIYCLLIILCFHLFDGESICVTKYRVGEWHSIALCITMSELPTMVFCYQNCSDLLWEKNYKISEITRTIYSNSERSEQFLVTECFFNLFLEVSYM